MKFYNFKLNSWRNTSWSHLLSYFDRTEWGFQSIQPACFIPVFILLNNKYSGQKTWQGGRATLWSVLTTKDLDIKHLLDLLGHWRIWFNFQTIPSFCSLVILRSHSCLISQARIYIFHFLSPWAWPEHDMMDWTEGQLNKQRSLEVREIFYQEDLSWCSSTGETTSLHLRLIRHSSPVTTLSR